MTVAGAFSIPLLGNAAHNILLGLPVIFLLFTKQIRQFPTLLRDNKTALIGTLIFLFMAVSISWSDAEGKYSTKILSKYREFLFIPLFMLYFSYEKYRNFTLATLYSALTLSLLFSYLIHYDIVNYWENNHSIGNRIFHGVTMSFYGYMSLQASVIFKKYKWVFATLFLITLHNLFFIENGRTGYILIISLSALFFWQKLNLKTLCILLALFIIACGLIYSLADLSHIRILGNLNALSSSGPISMTAIQQIDIRAEYYILSFLTFLQNWFIGCGLGCFPEAYAAKHSEVGTFWSPTVNAHNEFLQIAVQTGLIGATLFVAFVLSILLKSSDYQSEQKQFCSALFLLVTISCLFNSSFLDHGDGIYFMLLIALIAGKKWQSLPFSESSRAEVKHHE